VPGIRAYLQNPPPINIGGRQTRSQYQLTLEGTDTEELYRIAPRLLEAVARSRSHRRLERPHDPEPEDRRRDRSRPSRRARVTTEQIQRTLYNAYGSRQISTIYTRPTSTWSSSS